MSQPSLDLENDVASTSRTPWRRRFMQLIGVSTVSAVVMVAGCTGRVGDETVDTLSMESSTTTAPDSATLAPEPTSTLPPTSIGQGARSTSREESSSELQGLSSSGDEADAWTTTSVVVQKPAPTTSSTTSTIALPTTTIAPTTTTEALDDEVAGTSDDISDDADDESPDEPAAEPAVDDTVDTTTTTQAAAPQAPLTSKWSGPATVAHVVVDNIGVYRQPGGQTGPSGADWTFASKTQFGSPTTFLVVGSSGEWHEILLPVRQKHTRGWVHTSQIQTTSHNYHATVSVSSRRVVVYDNGVPVKDTGVVVGKSSTPTPLGRFYVTDKLRHANPGGAYGPWILALSARSEALTTFNGGEPIVALHGTNKPWLVGGGHSNGCIRMPNDVITKLAEFVPLGTPVDIVA